MFLYELWEVYSQLVLDMRDIAWCARVVAFFCLGTAAGELYCFPGAGEGWWRKL